MKKGIIYNNIWNSEMQKIAVIFDSPESSASLFVLLIMFLIARGKYIKRMTYMNIKNLNSTLMMFAFY